MSMCRNMVVAVAGALAAALVTTAQAAQLPSSWGTAISVSPVDPPSGVLLSDPFSLSVWSGAPDLNYTGIGGETVRYDFGASADTQIRGIANAKDIFVYEFQFGYAPDTEPYRVRDGIPEFDTPGDSVSVWVSKDGNKWVQTTNEETPTTVGLLIGDGAADDPAYIRGYDVPDGEYYRYLEVRGDYTEAGYGIIGGMNRGMDLDAVGANVTASVNPLPEPGTLAMLAIPAGLLLRRRR